MMDCPHCEESRYLLDEITMRHDAEIEALPLSIGQKLMMGAMLRRTGLPFSRAALIAAVRVGLPAGKEPTELVVDAQICYMRRRLKGTGYEIQTHWGTGYSARRPRKADDERAL